MTRKEMTEIFTIFLLAYPSAEIFKGGAKKLEPTIKLWTQALPEVDAQVGQEAAMQLCRVCKFPPTIAEFREQAEKIANRRLADAQIAWCIAKDMTPQELMQNSTYSGVISRIGGVERFEAADANVYQDFIRAFIECSAEKPLPKKLIGGTYE